jgi:hypothetical protein
MGLGDFATALEMKSLIEQLVRNEMEAQRPRYQYATVTSINRTTRKCGVQFPGETGSVTVNMGSIQPAAVGQTVRVGGLMGDRFVEDVMGETYTQPFQSTVDAQMWGINNLGTIVLGKTGDSAQKIIYWRKRTVDNTSDYEALQYLTGGTSTSTLDTVLRQDGTELGRYSLYADGSFRSTKGMRANSGDIVAAAGNVLGNNITTINSQISALTNRVSAVEQRAEGSVSITPVANTATSAYASFPSGRFSSTPSVVATAITTVPGTVVEVGVSGVTTSGCYIYVNRTNTTQTGIYWHAISA